MGADVAPVEPDCVVASFVLAAGALYDKNSATRIRFIKQAQSCGVALAEIRELLILRGQEAACYGDVRKRAIEKKLQLENKIRSLKSMSTVLDGLIADCANEAHSLGACTILAALERTGSMSSVAK